MNNQVFTRDKDALEEVTRLIYFVQVCCIRSPITSRLCYLDEEKIYFVVEMGLREQNGSKILVEIEYKDSYLRS